MTCANAVCEGRVDLRNACVRGVMTCAIHVVCGIETAQAYVLGSGDSRQRMFARMMNTEMGNCGNDDKSRFPVISRVFVRP